MRGDVSKMTVSPTARRDLQHGAGHQLHAAADHDDHVHLAQLDRDRRGSACRCQLAVGETAIFADTPSSSLLKHLLQREGGAAEWQSRRRLTSVCTKELAALAPFCISSLIPHPLHLTDPEEPPLWNTNTGRSRQGLDDHRARHHEPLSRLSFC